MLRGPAPCNLNRRIPHGSRERAGFVFPRGPPTGRLTFSSITFDLPLRFQPNFLQRTTFEWDLFEGPFGSRRRASTPSTDGKCKIEGGLFRVTLGRRALRRGSAWPIMLCKALLEDQGSQNLDRRCKNTHGKAPRSGPVAGTSRFGENRKMAENTFSGLAHARGGRLPEFFFQLVATIPASVSSSTLAQEARWIVLESDFRKLSANFPEALFRDCARAGGRRRWCLPRFRSLDQ